MASGLVGVRFEGTITTSESYAFNTPVDFPVGSDGSTELAVAGMPPSNIMNVNQISAANTTRWNTAVWDFGDTTQPPALKWVTDGTDCTQALLPRGQMCGGLIPGQR